MKAVIEKILTDALARKSEEVEAFALAESALEPWQTGLEG